MRTVGHMWTYRSEDENRLLGVDCTQLGQECIVCFRERSLGNPLPGIIRANVNHKVCCLRALARKVPGRSVVVIR